MNDVLFAPPGRPVGRLRRLKHVCWTAAGSCSLGGLYVGRICPTWIRFCRLEMPLPNLPGAFEGAHLVHISDLHCSPIVLERYLREVIRHVNEQRPDFVVVTGDLITGGTRYARRVADVLAGLQPTEATVACLGNHDFGIYHPRGHGHMRQLSGYLSRRLFEAGVHALRNQHAIFHRDGRALQFVGVDDLWSGSYDPPAAFAEARTDVPTIALIHNPDSADELLELGADWVLSGHTHGNGAGRSRIRDVVFPVKKRDLVGGYYAMPHGHLYVNRGLSYARRLWPNKRPEITVFTLRKAK